MDNLFNFSTNWNNKLNCKLYSSLRMSDRYNVGDKGIISFKQQPIHIGQIIAKNSIRLDAPESKYLDSIAYLDTGYDWKATLEILKKMYSLSSVSGKKIYHYIIQNTGETIPEATLL